jgi:hypothetical protein
MIKWAEHVESFGLGEVQADILVGKSEGNRPLRGLGVGLYGKEILKCILEI